MTQMMIKSPSGGGGAYTTTAKYIAGNVTPVGDSQSYSKDDWFPSAGGTFTFAGFYRVPDWQTNGGTFIKNTYIDISFRYWYDTFRQCMFDIDSYTVGYAAETRLRTDALYPSQLDIEEWFCLMYSFDCSIVGEPNRSCWLQRKGSSPINLYASYADRDTWQAGPLSFGWNDASSKWTIGSNLIDPNRGQNFEISDFVSCSKYVDWDDADNRALIVDVDGRPVSLGSDGSLLTGTQPEIYLIGGDGTDNRGSAGNFTVINGPIADASTSPSD